MARGTDELFWGLVEVLFKGATKARSPWAWLLAALWAVPFLYLDWLWFWARR